MDWQTPLTLAAVAGSVWYLIGRLRRWRSSGSCGGCAGCPKPAGRTLPLVRLEGRVPDRRPRRG